MKPTIIGTGKPFISPILYEEFDCEAYQELGPNDIAVYLALRRRYNGRNNGQISFSACEAGRACRKSRSTGNRSLLRLQKFGFLYLHFFGQPGRASQYELTALALEECSPFEIKTGRCLFLDWKREADVTLTHETSHPCTLEEFRKVI